MLCYVCVILICIEQGLCYVFVFWCHEQGLCNVLYFCVTNKVKYEQDL